MHQHLKLLLTLGSLVAVSGNPYGVKGGAGYQTQNTQAEDEYELGSGSGDGFKPQKGSGGYDLGTKEDENVIEDKKIITFSEHPKDPENNDHYGVHGFGIGVRPPGEREEGPGIITGSLRPTLNGGNTRHDAAGDQGIYRDDQGVKDDGYKPQLPDQEIKPDIERFDSQTFSGSVKPPQFPDQGIKPDIGGYDETLTGSKKPQLPDQGIKPDIGGFDSQTFSGSVKPPHLPDQEIKPDIGGYDETLTGSKKPQLPDQGIKPDIGGFDSQTFSGSVKPPHLPDQEIKPDIGGYDETLTGSKKPQLPDQGIKPDIGGFDSQTFSGSVKPPHLPDQEIKPDIGGYDETLTGSKKPQLPDQGIKPDIGGFDSQTFSGSVKPPHLPDQEIKPDIGGYDPTFSGSKKPHHESDSDESNEKGSDRDDSKGGFFEGLGQLFNNLRKTWNYYDDKLEDTADKAQGHVQNTFKTIHDSGKEAAQSLGNKFHSFYSNISTKIPQLWDDFKKHLSQFGVMIHRGAEYSVKRVSLAFDDVKASQLVAKLQQRLEEGDELVDEFFQKVGEKVSDWMEKHNHVNVDQGLVAQDKEDLGQHYVDPHFPDLFQDPEIHGEIDKLVAGGIIKQEEADLLSEKKVIKNQWSQEEKSDDIKQNSKSQLYQEDDDKLKDVKY